MTLDTKRVARAIALLCACALPVVDAKPIAFAHGTTVMGEYGAGTMTEVQAFYAPTFRYSLGGGFLRLESDEGDFDREIAYARINFLPKRWNMERAQANVFVWASAGRAYVSDIRDDEFAWNVGGQFDYETRRVYASFRTDLHQGNSYSHRIDTLQLGVAPYQHDMETLAVWFVVQARQYSNRLYDGTEYAGMVRLFKRNAWLEAGLTQDGNVQAMLMFNF